MAKKRIPKQVEFLDRKQMQEKLDFCKKCTFVLFRKKEENESFKLYSFIEDLRSNLKVSFKIGGKACTYQFKLDTGEVTQRISGVDSFKILSRYYKVPKIRDCSHKGSARPFLYRNKEYDCTRHYAYGYDLNSAYSWAMLQDMPDTESGVVGRYRKVKSGEIGFCKLDITESIPEYMTDKDDLIMVDTGMVADVIYKKMESPFKRFVAVWYNKKKKASCPEEKQKAKGVLNYSIGYLQNVNPYIRATILTHVNNRISSLVDKNTLFCNTDSLVSLVRRPDIEANIGDEIGQWKLEHQGYFAYKGFNYQWDDNVPTYRGQPKAYFKKGFDLLTDLPPETRNKYYLDHKTLQIKEIDYGKKEKIQKEINKD